jgi:hypothetical protein
MSDRFTYTQLGVFLAAFAISSLGGLAALIRSGKELTIRAIIGALLYSGIIGLIIALAWYNYFEGAGNIPFLLAISGLAGIGGATVLDLIKLFLVGKLNISVDAHLPQGLPDDILDDPDAAPHDREGSRDDDRP